MLKIFFLTLMSLILWGCSNEQGIPTRLHQKTEPIPAEIVSSASRRLDLNGKMVVYGSSLSSQALRQDTLGFVLHTTPAGDGQVSLQLNHYQSYNNNNCRNTIQTGTFKLSELSTSWKALNTAEVSCFNLTCDYMMVVMQFSLSSFVDGTGEPVPAYVPVIFSTTDPVNGPRNYRLAEATTPFLSLDTNLICPQSDEVVIEQRQYIIPPVDTSVPDYSYFPDLDNNTWIN